jgi:peptidoglycan biosynthesis protein MviN/MurJ (putative lipid II flippase)
LRIENYRHFSQSAFSNQQSALQADESAYLQSRRGFKMVVHISVLLLLVTGTYNAILNWPAYHRNVPLTHALFGPHVLLGITVLVILMVMLARKQPGSGERKWMRVTVVLLFLTVLVASALKYAREHPKPQATELRG